MTSFDCNYSRMHFAATLCYAWAILHKRKKNTETTTSLCKCPIWIRSICLIDKKRSKLYASCTVNQTYSFDNECLRTLMIQQWAWNSWSKCNTEIAETLSTNKESFIEWRRQSKCSFVHKMQVHESYESHCQSVCSPGTKDLKKCWLIYGFILWAVHFALANKSRSHVLYTAWHLDGIQNKLH